MQKEIMTLKNIGEIAEKIAKKLKNGGVLLLKGDLGAGKTTLTKEIAEKIGIKNISIKSPSYTYIRAFSIQKFYHIDLYRIEGSDELINQEIAELLLDKSKIIIIEWADRLDEEPENALKIELKYIDEDNREIKYRKF